MGGSFISWSDLKLDEAPFARGGGGQIYRGKYMANAVAAKEVFEQGLKGNDCDAHAEFFAECAVLSRLAHPNVIQLYGVAESPRGELFMIFDLCSGGDLQAYLSHPNFQTPDEFTRVALELISGVWYLHGQGIGHR